MKRFLVLVALLALVVPAAFAAAPAGKGKPSDNEKNAAKSCKAERALGVDAFNKKYGTNHNLKNGFGKCVSGKSKKKTEGDQQGTLNAAKQCKKERADMGVEAFANRYGTNHNKANAFGKCVSSKAQGKDDVEDDDVESAEDADEADDD